MLDAPEQGRAYAETGPEGRRRRAMVTEMPLRRNASYANGTADDNPYDEDLDADEDSVRRPRRAGVRLSFHGGLMPKTLWGRIAAGGGLLLLAAAGVAATLAVRSFLLHDEHFTVPSADAIQIAGNSHLTHAQALSVFGGDVERNLFTIPLAERRAELESLPWVEHATVMRLLPNRVRVAIVERTPVAFVRQGSQIGLVDANGVLLDLPGPEMDAPGAPRGTEAPRYSFPVLTGISAEDPLSTRAARMRIYLGFIAALDATGEKISHRLSEVDVSNPEDVTAVLPGSVSGPGTGAAAGDGAEILVHFGDERYLERYREYEQNLPQWLAQYPRLASVDLRYERQAVLEMQPGEAASASAAARSPTAASDTVAASGTATAGDAVAATAPVRSVDADRAKAKTAKAAATGAGRAASTKRKKIIAAQKRLGRPRATATGVQQGAR